MNLDNINENIVVFIDILGMSNDIRKCDTKEDIRNLVDKVNRLREIFTADYEPWLYMAPFLKSRKFSYFSDCAFLNVPMGRYMSPVFFEEFIAYISIVQAKCVHDGIFLRGGIEFSWLFSEDNTLIGPAAIDTVRLESEALMPIITVGEDFYNTFVSPTVKRNENGKPMRSDYFSDFLIDKNGLYFIDYIKVYCEQDLVVKGIFEKAKWLSIHAKSIEKAYQSAPNDKAKEKYIWLAEYHNLSVDRVIGEDVGFFSKVYCELG
ncbi:hypothetical protein [Vibrio sp. 99-8-1]|uniref:hypothetical protein n=1 Tax=Vibrio sp. 99-8-1 TaxID=2607602 RepID=UPI0014934922|nr:hypothetical protein [Vibrio sp. 99-8-1]NOI66854.1 hypothetical protein [Vibrio sp. 99-8-1]